MHFFDLHLQNLFSIFLFFSSYYHLFSSLFFLFNTSPNYYLFFYNLYYLLPTWKNIKKSNTYTIYPKSILPQSYYKQYKFFNLIPLKFWIEVDLTNKTIENCINYSKVIYWGNKNKLIFSYISYNYINSTTSYLYKILLTTNSKFSIKIIQTLYTPNTISFILISNYN